MTDTRKHRSVSQFKQYERCPFSYKLARIDKVWQRPAAWLAQGSAVHEAIEAREKSGRTLTLEQAQDVFRESYQRHIREACEVTPNFDYWFRSGPYGGEQDIERRFNIGLEQVEKYFSWSTGHPEERFWTAPDGTLGIELEFDIDLDGVLVRGYIDQVLEDCVRDVKTGNTPGDEFQLATYKVALKKQYGLDINQGDYWMGRSGKPTYPYDLSGWTERRVTDLFHELEDNIQAERFEPDPEPSKCAFCDVNTSCPFAMA